MNDLFFPIFNTASGLYLLWFAVAMKTKNGLSSFLFKFLPLIIGLGIAAQGVRGLGLF